MDEKFSTTLDVILPDHKVDPGSKINVIVPEKIAIHLATTSFYALTTYMEKLSSP